MTRFVANVDVNNQRDPVKDTMRFVKAFTLIEMLVVIAIIGILAALLLSALRPPKTVQDGPPARVI